MYQRVLMYVQSCCFANKTTHSELFFDVHNGYLKSLVTTSYSATISTWASTCASQQPRTIKGHVHYKRVWIGEFASHSITTTFFEISGCSWLRLRSLHVIYFQHGLSEYSQHVCYKRKVPMRTMKMIMTLRQWRNMISKRTCLNLEPTWKRKETKWESEI